MLVVVLAMLAILVVAVVSIAAAAPEDRPGRSRRDPVARELLAELDGDVTTAGSRR